LIKYYDIDEDEKLDDEYLITALNCYDENQNAINREKMDKKMEFYLCNL
jgi:hypothetical protein